MEFGRHARHDAAGLTVGLTLFPAPPVLGAVKGRAVTRVYSCGTLDGETDLGEVIVHNGRS